MPDRETIDAYDRAALDWIRTGQAQDDDHVRWVAAGCNGGPILDIGCGPGWSLADVRGRTIALDASQTMLDQVPSWAPKAARVQADAAALPLARGSIGGALANRVYLHLAQDDVPMALAGLHGAIATGGRAFIRVIGDELGTHIRSNGRLPGRLFSGWSATRFEDLCVGAGFTIEQLEVGQPEDPDHPSRMAVRLTRSHSLPDTVGAGMRLLICGLNPSPYSADSGIGFGRPGNRFWPAAIEAGVVSRDRDPGHALRRHGVGMTDLVKRTTRTANELTRPEYAAGLERVRRLVGWLQPWLVCFVGLAGWRAAVDRKAVAGIQPTELAGRPVYVMPSTSGLNASSRLSDLVDHLRAAKTAAGEAM